MLLNTLSGAVPTLAHEYALPGRTETRTGWSPRAARSGAGRRLTRPHAGKPEPPAEAMIKLANRNIHLDRLSLSPANVATTKAHPDEDKELAGSWPTAQTAPVWSGYR